MMNSGALQAQIIMLQKKKTISTVVIWVIETPWRKEQVHLYVRVLLQHTAVCVTSNSACSKHSNAFGAAFLMKMGRPNL